jgi:methanethiol S-methyltransferase
MEEALMARVLALAYGVAAYLVFLGTFLYAIGFVSGIAVPKALNTGAVVSAAEALTVNILLLSFFAVQHSVMARKTFKRWWTQLVPVPVERSTYVLLSSFVLMLLFWQWRPMTTVLWQIGNPVLATTIQGLSFLGWLTVLMSSFLINHFEFLGLQQVINNLAGTAAPEPRFRTPFLYKLVRHPLYLGFIIAFWATPT